MIRLFTALPVTFNQSLYLLEDKITEQTVGRKRGVILRGLTSGSSDKSCIQEATHVVSARRGHVRHI